MNDQSKVQHDFGIEIGGPGRAYFDNVMTDNILDALVELSAVMWTIQDRQIILERVLEEKGIDAAALIEAYKPTDQDLAMRRAERDQIVERVFRSFLRRPNGGVAKTADDPSLREITD